MLMACVGTGRVISAQKTIPSQIDSIYMQIVERIFLEISRERDATPVPQTAP